MNLTMDAMLGLSPRGEIAGPHDGITPPNAGFCQSLTWGHDPQVVKRRDAVRLGPQPDLASLAEGGVLHLEESLAVEQHCHQVALDIDLEDPPFFRRDRGLHPCPPTL